MSQRAGKNRANVNWPWIIRIMVIPYAPLIIDCLAHAYRFRCPPVCNDTYVVAPITAFLLLLMDSQKSKNRSYLYFCITVAAILLYFLIQIDKISGLSINYYSWHDFFYHNYIYGFAAAIATFVISLYHRPWKKTKKEKLQSHNLSGGVVPG